MANRLAGSGPSGVGGGHNDGPSPMLSGTLGVAPQAAPQQGPMPGPQNMLAGAEGGQQSQQGGMPGQPQAPMVPPSRETLMDVAQKQSVITSHLKMLLGKADLKTKDILNSVGEIVADGVMSPFDTANYLADLPPNDPKPLELRQWVANHYANASKNFQIVTSMLSAHGQMTRDQAAMSAQPQANRFSQMSAPPQGGNALGAMQ